jgi:dienelactone hydrolase
MIDARPIRVRRPFRPGRVFLGVGFLAAIVAAGSWGTPGAMKGESLDPEEARAALWSRIAPHFEPPPESAGNFGDYRDLFKFEDGRVVETAGDWVARRRELLELWQGWMGEWPPLLENAALTVLSKERREDFCQKRVRLQWTPAETTDGYLLVPDGVGPHPAVVVVFYEPESAIGLGREQRDFAYQLTRRGFVTLSLGTTEATQAGTFSLYHPSLEQAEVQPLSMLAYAAANAWHALAARPEVDPERIGIAGHSFGGKWAMFASCLFEKFACAAWSDPGIVFDESRQAVNYWEPWYLGYHPPPWRRRGRITEENPAHGLYLELVARERDLHELHALMAPRPFFVSGGSEDPPSRWEALNHTRAVNELLGYAGRVGMANRPEHSPNRESNDQMMQFFEYFLLHRGIDRTRPVGN